MTNHQPSGDSSIRRRALDPAQSFIVQAPAGSGKTEMLTQRYLVLLAGVAAPEEVVAITFTRKAAAEMRNRILTALERSSDSDTDLAPHERLSRELAHKVRERDLQAGWDLTHNPARLRIQTIDSLCATLARQLPLLSGLGAPPAVMEQATPLYREAARNTLAELEQNAPWSPAVQRLLVHLDNRVDLLESLICVMLVRRDQWLRHLADHQDPRVERQNLEAALEDLVRAELAVLAEIFPKSAEADLLKLARFAASNLELDGQASPLRCLADLTSLPCEHPSNVSLWQGLADMLLTREGEWRKRANKSLGFPAPSSAHGKAAKENLKVMKERFGLVVTSLAEQTSYGPQYEPGDLRARLHRTRSLPPVRYHDDQWSVVEALLILLRIAVAQLYLEFRAQARVDFTELSQRAVQALGPADDPTDLALALDYRIHHLLVDEFQDTSQSQYLLLERLTGGWVSGDGHSLFLVGDPMQSIYRFREAEVGLFMRAWRTGIGQLPLTPLRLKTNFRSQAGIVDWVNRSFPKVFPTTADISAGAVPFAPAEAAKPRVEAAAVTVHGLLNQDKAGEAEAVVALVRQARDAHPDGQLAVLVRSRSHLSELLPRLTRASFRHRAVEVEALGERPVVQDLRALTRALNHLADRVSWLAILRAPWCGLTLSDLNHLAGDDHQDTIWSLIGQQERMVGLSADGQKRLGLFRDVLESSLANRNRGTLRAWVETAWLNLGGPACVERESDLADADVYLALLEACDEGGSLKDFVLLDERIDRLFSPPDTQADDRLQIMTIHKAKGLEFDTVILPGLDRTPPAPDHPLLLWMERPRGQLDGTAGQSDLLLAPIKRSGTEEDPIYAYLEGFDAQQAAHEDARLLYVAVTRAKQRLHLVGRAKVGRAGVGRAGVKSGDEPLEVRAPDRRALLAKLWPVVEDVFQATLRQHPPADIPEHDLEEDEPNAGTMNTDTTALMRRLAPGWTPPPLAPSVPWASPYDHREADLNQSVEFSWAGERARQVGTLVHRQMRRIGQEGISHWDEARVQSMGQEIRNALLQLGVAGSVLEDACVRTQAALSRALRDKRGRWILSSQHREAQCEYGLTGILDGSVINLVIDRTFVDDQGVRWIIDYKTGSHQGTDLVEAFLDREQIRYRPQLERYAAIMALREGRPIRLGLYFPLLQGWREWRV